MKKSFVKFIVVLLASLIAGFAFADSIHYASADESPALRFQNLGSEAVTINIYAGDSATNSVTIGSTVTTIDMSGAVDTVAEVAAAIVAAVNSDGVPVLLADTRCSLGTDSTDDELLDSQVITIAAKSGGKAYWGEAVWDTSVALFYSVYIPAALQAESGTRADIDIAQIYGNPLGTGDGTLSVIIDGELAWQMQNTELFLATNAVATPVGIPAGSKSVLMRAARATTATTGQVGILAKPTVQQ